MPFSRRQILTLPAASALAAAAPALDLTISITDHRILTREGVREPQLYKLRSGELLLSFHTQPDLHFARRQAMRSTDGGQTWQSDLPRSHREQAIGESPTGVVLANDIYTFERKPGEYFGSYFRSEDGGKTFTGPHRTTVYVNRVASSAYPTAEHFPPDDHPIRKFYQPLPAYYGATVEAASPRTGFSFWRYLLHHNGRWLAPMQGRFHADRGLRTILVASEDNGQTWRFVSTIGVRYDSAGDGMCEPALIRAADGSLLCMMRRGGGLPLAQSRSTDGGLTWSTPELLAAHGVDPDLHLLSNGMLACTYGRPGLHMMFSPDGSGHSWGYRTQIGEWRSSTYMGIAEVAPGELLLAYDRNQATTGEGRSPGDGYVCSAKVKLTPRA